MRLICVAFKSTTTFAAAKWQDATRLLDYGFSQYKTYTFSELYDMLNLTVPISGAPADDPSGGIIHLSALINRSGSYEKMAYVGSLNELFEDFKNHLSIEYTRDLIAPIEVGTVIGRLTFTPEDGDVITAVLVSDRSVAAVPAEKTDYLGALMSKIPDWVYTLLIALAALLAVLISCGSSSRSITPASVPAPASAPVNVPASAPQPPAAIAAENSRLPFHAGAFVMPLPRSGRPSAPTNRFSCSAALRSPFQAHKKRDERIASLFTGIT